MKIKYGGNKKSAKVFEINNFEKKIDIYRNNVKNMPQYYTARFLTSSSIQSSKNKHHQPTFKSKF